MLLEISVKQAHLLMLYSVKSLLECMRLLTASLAPIQKISGSRNNSLCECLLLSTCKEDESSPEGCKCLIVNTTLCFLR